MDSRFKIYLSESFDPKVNLSVEEWLMESSKPYEMVLFLWQNENTIVIGRNQNPYKECDITKIKEEGVQLIRRLSGGGAVYHDLGNLNFTFITSDENYNVEANMKVILNSISKFGINGYFTGRNDLEVKKRKFSGSAFMNDNGMNCHHGTLLVDVDLNKLSRYLTVSPLKIESKGIDSVKSRVINLKEIAPQITVESLKGALIESFNDYYSTKPQIITVNKDTMELVNYIEKYDSREWNYSESPDFSIAIEEKFTWGIFEIHLDISDGKINNCRVFTDSIVLEDFKKLEKNLLNKDIEDNKVLQSIEQCIKDEQIKKDLYCLFKSKF